MLELKADLWSLPDDNGVKGITTNGVTKRENGNWVLVMGAGVAKQAKDRFPDLPKILGQHVEMQGNLPLYVPEYNIVSFPTKEDWRQRSLLHLIQNSAYFLKAIIREHNLERVYLPRVGCGLGGLSWEKEVRPLLVGILPDTVTIVHNE